MITFSLNSEQEIEVLKDGKKVGHIFSPSGSAKDNENCIQVCGFNEIFDYWSCGIFEGKKDIQIHFGEKKMPGIHDTNSCLRCYKKPCCCNEAFVMKRESDIIAEEM